MMTRTKSFLTNSFNSKPIISNNRASSSISCIGANVSNAKKKLPVLLFDVMDTIVRDPFYHDVPAFFGMPMKELLECKHPMTWIEFEKGLIDEEELARKFFIDGRDFDLEGLKECMRSGYNYLDGMQELLQSLKTKSFDIHAFTNYPIWYKMIEDKLKLSDYLSWTFCSYNVGKRKPDPEFYLEVVTHLGVKPSDCIFVDDRQTNVKCAIEEGMCGLVFENVDSLLKDLSRLGIDV
ncbi:unnamed protein product [Cochlearia groenlandica]